MLSAPPSFPCRRPPARRWRLAGLLISVCLVPAVRADESSCPVPLTRKALDDQLTSIRDLLLSDRAMPARRELAALEEQVLCASEPISGGPLAQLFYLEAAASWNLREEAEAERQLTTAFALFPDLEWDSELASELGLSTHVARFRELRGKVLTYSSIASFQVAAAGPEGHAYVDGRPFAPSGQEKFEAVPGRHLVQFKTRRAVWDNTWIDLRPSIVTQLRPSRGLDPWEKAAEIAAEGLWLPAENLDLSAYDFGLRFAFRVEHGAFAGDVWLSVYGTRLAGTDENDLADTYSNQLLPAVFRGGVSAGPRLRFDSGLELGGGLALGGLSVPYVEAYCPAVDCDAISASTAGRPARASASTARTAARASASTARTAARASASRAGSPARASASRADTPARSAPGSFDPEPLYEVRLPSSAGGFATLRGQVRWQRRRLHLSLGLEGGYALLFTLPEDGEQGLAGQLGTPVLAASLQAAYRF